MNRLLHKSCGKDLGSHDEMEGKGWGHIIANQIIF